jgi:hypothetical protein
VGHQAPYAVSSLIPGGIRPGDFVHVETNDGTCSRCRRRILEDEVPLMLWDRTGRLLWIYCDDCTGASSA